MLFPVSGVEVNPLILPLMSRHLHLHRQGESVRGFAFAPFPGKYPHHYQPRHYPFYQGIRLYIQT